MSSHSHGGAVPEQCPCGEPGCWYFAAGYLYCWGCGEHHREPVGEQPGVLCPVGEWDRYEPDD